MEATLSLPHLWGMGVGGKIVSLWPDTKIVFMPVCCTLLDFGPIDANSGPGRIAMRPAEINTLAGNLTAAAD